MRPGPFESETDDKFYLSTVYDLLPCLNLYDLFSITMKYIDSIEEGIITEKCVIGQKTLYKVFT